MGVAVEGLIGLVVVMILLGLVCLLFAPVIMGLIIVNRKIYRVFKKVMGKDFISEDEDYEESPSPKRRKGHLVRFNGGRRTFGQRMAQKLLGGGKGPFA